MYSIQIVLLFLDHTWATAQSTSNLMPLLDYLIQLMPLLDYLIPRLYASECYFYVAFIYYLLIAV